MDFPCLLYLYARGELTQTMLEGVTTTSNLEAQSNQQGCYTDAVGVRMGCKYNSTCSYCKHRVDEIDVTVHIHVS